MPMTRYQVRNEYSLADPELYKAADKDDPEALLEGVAMAGLVGVLRQLGDLAEFAAEIFHDLHEEVMVTAARGHTLMSRVQQLESEFPPIEKAFLSQTSHSTFFSNSGTEWHPNLQTNQNLITKGDLPRFVMDSYEEARGPPRLFLLDKFDIAGAGSCLKRYTDPSFYKVEASFLDLASVDVQRDKKFRKAKKKGPRWMHGGTPEILPSIKLHQLFLEERVESGASDPARLVKLKRKSSASSFGSENGKSYMEKFLKTPPEDEMVHEVFVGSSPLKLPSKSTTGSGHEIQLDVSNVGSDAEPIQRIRGPYPPPSLGRTIVSPSENDFFEDIVEEKTSVGPTSNHSFDDKDVVVDGEIKAAERESNHSDYDDASEIDSYMDALATMESEVETDTEFRPKKGDDVGFLNTEKHRMDSNPNDEHLLSQSQSQFSDSQSIGNFTASDDGNSSIRKGVSSFSCSDDTASTSAEDTPSPSNQDSIIDKVGADQLPEHEASDNGKNSDKSGELELSDASSDASEILSDPTKTEEQQTDDKSEISCGPTETEELAAEESGEISSGLTEINAQPTDDNGKISGGLTKMEEQLANVDDMLERGDEITPRLSYEEHLEDEAEIEDSYVDSCTVIDKANNFEEIHEKDGSENSLEDVIQTNFVENVSARNSVDTQVMSPDSVISHPEEQPSVLHLEGLAGNPNDDLSDKFDSAEIGLDGTRDGKLSRDSESDVEEGEIETHMNPMASEFLSHVSEYQDRPSLSDNHSQSDGREDKIVHAEDEVKSGCKSSLPEDPAGGSEFTSQLESIDYPDHMNHKTDINTDFDSSELTIPTQPLEQEKELHVEELDVGPLLVGKETRESSQLDLVESNETDRESLPGPTLGEASVFELPQTSNHTFDFSQKVNAPLNQASDFPGFNLLPEVAQLNLEEMPPLPPLPPMQWRIGKFQHAYVPSGGDDGQQVDHFPHIFPSIHNENVQASNPFLPVPPMKVEDSRHEDLMGNMVNSTPFLLQMPIPNLVESRDDFVDLKETQSLNPFGAVSETNSESPQHARGGVVIQPTVDHVGSCNDHLTLGQSQSSNHLEAGSAPSDEKSQHAEEGEMIQPTVDEQLQHAGEEEMIQPSDNSFTPGITPGPTPTCSSETPNGESTESPHQLSTEQLQHAGEEEMIHPFDNSFTPGITPGPTPRCSSETPNGESTESPHQLSTEASLRKEEQDHSSLVSEMIVVGPTEDFVPHPPVEIWLPGKPEHVEPATEEETVCSTSTSGLPSVDDEKPNALPSVDNEKSNGNQIPKFPRPRSPLIDAVAAHDKSKLRKVTERVRPQVQKVEEKDSILEQIRMKSFNLKPAVATRPTIHGPRTNLRVAAILEKANAIRQAFAGSDDDDDDSWSDS